MLSSIAFAVFALTSPLSNPSATLSPFEPDSGYLVVDQGGWRGSSLRVGPYKSTRIRESGRKEWRNGNFLTGEVRERWQVQFDIDDGLSAAPGRSHCELDRLVTPAKNVKLRIEDARMFAMSCTLVGNESWFLSADAALPAASATTADAADFGFPIGSLSSADESWTIVAKGARRLLPYLWSHPNSFVLRNSDGEVDAEIFVRDRRRVWLRPDLPEATRAALTRAAVAILVAEPLVADMDSLNN
jgi:hypothetical protein